MAALQVAALDREFPGDLVAIKDLSPRDPEQLLDAVTGAAAKHQKEPLAGSFRTGEVLKEAGVFSFGEWAGRHA